MQDWLKSPPPGKSGGAGSFLKGGWKKKPGHVDTWLVGLPMTVWQHGFATLVPIEDRDTKEKTVHVWTKKYTCHETEDVLDRMYFRETKGEPTSPRQHPPKRCGFCKFLEWTWQQCWAWLETHEWDDNAKEWKEAKKGKGRGIDPCAVLFKFVSEADDKENQTIHAGGFCGLFGRRELPDDLTAAMKAKKIYPKEAWKENSTVKPQSVMCVVDNDNPGGGVVIASETKELGEKVKEEITRVYKSQEVNIEEKPYCIRWEYDSGQQMGKQYSATAMFKIKPTDRILKMARGKLPDLSSIETPFNMLAMLATLQHHCKVKGVPWNELFPTKEQIAAWNKEDEENADEEEEESDDDKDADKAEDKDGTDDDDDDDDEDEEVECDACHEAMKLSDPKCPHCGKSYEEAEESAPEPEKPKVRSRSEAKAEAKAKETNGGGSKKNKPKPKEDDDGNQEDDIPFARVAKDPFRP